MSIKIACEYPLVSVIAISYNHARWVLECLESVKAQTYKNVELIYADDASQDESAQIATQWLSAHIPSAKRITHQTNRGLCSTLNEALRLVSGQYVQLLSCDDVLARYKIATQVEALQGQSESIGFVFGNFGTIDEDSKVISDIAYSKEVVPPTDLLAQVLDPDPARPGIAMLTTLLRRQVFTYLGSFDENLPFEGIQLWVRVLPRFGWLYLPERLAWYRIARNSLSRSTATCRQIQLGVLHLMELLAKEPSYIQWKRQITNRRLRALRWLLADAAHRRNAEDFVAIYERHNEFQNGRLEDTQVQLFQDIRSISALLWLALHPRTRAVAKPFVLARLAIGKIARSISGSRRLSFFKNVDF